MKTESIHIRRHETAMRHPNDNTSPLIICGLLALIALLFNGHTAAHAGSSKGTETPHGAVVAALKNGDHSKAVAIIEKGPRSLWLVTYTAFREVAEPNLKLTVLGGDDYIAVYPLLAAVAATGNTAVAQALMDKGARVDHRLQEEGSSALMFAAKQHQLEMVRLLLDNGANAALLTKDRRPSCALMFALEFMESGDEELVALALLESPHAERTLGQLPPVKVRAMLETAAYNGLLQVIHRFNEMGIPLTGRNRLGATLLHYALMGGTQGGEDVALYLVQQGVDPNQHYATDRLLQMAEAGVPIQDEKRDGKTPLIIGIEEGVSPQFVEDFIKLGADPNARSLGQITPIQAAHSQKRADLIEILKGNGEQ